MSAHFSPSSLPPSWSRPPSRLLDSCNALLLNRLLHLQSWLLLIHSPSSGNTDILKVEIRSHHCPSLNPFIAFHCHNKTQPPYGSQQGSAYLGNLACHHCPLALTTQAPRSSVNSHLQRGPERGPCTAQGLTRSRQYFTGHADGEKK